MIKLNRIFLKRIIKKYGVEKQLDMVIEECSELIQAVCKYKRHEGNRKLEEGIKDIHNIIEEAVDIELMIQQLQYIFNSEKIWERIQLEKIVRLENKVFE